MACRSNNSQRPIGSLWEVSGWPTPAAPASVLTSHAPVDRVHAVVVEEVGAGRLQGTQSWAGLRSSLLPRSTCLPPECGPGPRHGALSVVSVSTQGNVALPAV